MTRYTVVESKVWKRDDGKTASIYSACPWTSDDEKARWSLVTVGWTVKDTALNTFGIGRAPFKTQEQAQALADKLNS